MGSTWLGLLSLMGILLSIGCGQDASFRDNTSYRSESEQPSLDAIDRAGADSETPDDKDLLEHLAEIAGTVADDITSEPGAEVLVEGVASGSKTPTPVTAESLAAKCQTDEVVMVTQSITFDEPQETCSWGSDAAPNMGNIAKLDRRIGARYRQNSYLDLPEGALLCDLALDSVDDSKDGQEMYYDDEIFLTFNNFILAASQSYDDHLEKKDGLLIYDWDKIVAQKYGQNLFDPYCAGADQGMGTCYIPPTQTKGIMKVEFSDDVIQRIAVASGANKASDDMPAPADKKDFEFSFITIGDNDDPIDCKHSKFEFKVSAQYVVFK